MTLIVIIGLLFVAVCLLIAKRRKLSVSLFTVTFILFVLTGEGVFSSALLNRLEAVPMPVQAIWQKHNAIVLLGAGATQEPHTHKIMPLFISYGRIYEAARLYFSCKKDHGQCTIIISGGDAMRTGKSEAAVYQDALIALAVNSKDILLEEKSMNTYKNAEYTSALLKAGKFDHIVLVTSGIHLQRALLYFAHFGIIATPAMADYIPATVSLIPCGYYLAMTDFALHEYIGILRFHLYNYLGSNNKANAVGFA